jgi:hypothetical protein
LDEQVGDLPHVNRPRAGQEGRLKIGLQDEILPYKIHPAPAEAARMAVPDKQGQQKRQGSRSPCHIDQT